jgi:ribosomal protein S18 acetylase RimI-like enzyme
MQDLTFQNYRSCDLARLADFVTSYLEKHPDAKLNKPEFYTYHPALEEGENVFCVLNSEQQMVGFAPLFPVLTTHEGAITGPHDIWTIILARPDLPVANDVRELLFDGVLQRVSKLKAAYGLTRVKLAADMMISQQADLDYLLQKGFEPFEQVYVMRRHTTQPIPTIGVPPGMSFRQSKIATAEEQAAYVDVYNACFPEAPKTAADLQFFFESFAEPWSVISAYSPADDFVGSILVYGDVEKDFGVTDDVMVLPQWRGQKIAKALIAEGLRFFKAHNIPIVRLEVKAGNAAAMSVYTSMEFKVINQESLLGKLV